MSLTFLACDKKSITKEEVKGIWFLKEIEGEEAAYLFGGGLPTLNFDWENQRLYGTGGCNRYTANYLLDGTDLAIEQIESTTALCENAQMEERFFSLLKEVTDIKVDKDAIVLMKKKQEVLHFLRLDITGLTDKK